MQIRVFTAAMALAVSSSAVLAESYQVEIGNGYSITDSEFGDRDTIALTGEFHFSPVELRDHPLAEAAFLERSSYVFAGMIRPRWEFGSVVEDTVVAGLEYYVPNNLFFVAAALSRSKREYDFFVVDRRRIDNWSIAGGITPMEGMLLTLGWRETETGWDELDEDGDWNIGGKYVIAVNDTSSINIEFNYFHADNDGFDIGADYYIDRTWSIGAAYLDYDGDQNANDEGVMRTRKFFTDSFSAGVFASRHRGDETYGIELDYRL